MSFAKAEQLLDLATMLRAHRSGITLSDVEDRFGCSRRTAQRMMRQLEARFPDVQGGMDDDGYKRWRMPTGALKDFLSLHADESRRWTSPLLISRAKGSPAKRASSRSSRPRSWHSSRARRPQGSRPTTTRCWKRKAS